MSRAAQKDPNSLPPSVEPWIPVNPTSSTTLQSGDSGAGQKHEPQTMRWVGDDQEAAILAKAVRSRQVRRTSSLKLLGWIALGVGAPLLVAAAFSVLSPLFDVIEYQTLPAPRAFAPETTDSSAAHLLMQNPADYDWKAAVSAERRRLESERDSEFAEVFKHQIQKADALTTPAADKPSDSPAIASAPKLNKRSISSPSVDSALRSNEARVASKPPAASPPPLITSRIQTEAISRAHTVSTEIGSLNDDTPTLGALDGRKLDKNFGAVMALLPDGMPPRILIRYDGYSAEARRRAEKLAKSLADRRYEIADVRRVASPIRSELRFSYAPDEAAALRIGYLTGLKPVRTPPNVRLMARPGLIELSVSAR